MPSAPDPSSRRRGWVIAMVVVGWLLLLVPVGLLVVRATPSQSWWPATQVVGALPWSWPLAVVTLALGVGARRGRPGRLLLVASALVVLLLGALLAPRSLGSLGSLGSPSPRAGSAHLGVLAANAYLGKADAAQVAALARDHQIDVLCLSENSPTFDRALRAAGLADELSHQINRPEPGAGGSAIWSRLPLTELDPVPNTGFVMPRAVIHVGPADVTLTCVHTSAPLRSQLAAWESDLRALADTVRVTSGPQLVLGDFNATWDHRLLREVARAGGLHDAAQATGGGLVPTWPTISDMAPIPRPLFTLDHALTDLPVLDAMVHDVVGSDHRAVSATLAVG